MGKKRATSYIVNTAVVVLLFVVTQILLATKVLDAFINQILILILINVILAVSLNLVTGILGQLVLGHAGFMGVGAYAAALFVNKIVGELNCPPTLGFVLGVVVGGIVAGLLGIIIGIPALRLRGDYLAIITLGFGFIIRNVLNNLSFTGGSTGMRAEQYITSFPTVFIFAVITVAFTFTFGTSRHGRGVVAIREDEIAAEASGINTTNYKLLAFVLSAFFAGIAGGVYAHHLGYINPNNFDFNYSVDILIMVVLGGMGSITGAVISAASLTVINIMLDDIFSQFPALRMLLYAVILIVVMLFRPSGLLGRKEFSMTKLIDKISGLFKKKSTNSKGGL